MHSETLLKFLHPTNLHILQEQMDMLEEKNDHTERKNCKNLPTNANISKNSNRKPLKCHKKKHNLYCPKKELAEICE